MRSEKCSSSDSSLKKDKTSLGYLCNPVHKEGNEMLHQLLMLWGTLKVCICVHSCQFATTVIRRPWRTGMSIKGCLLKTSSILICLNILTLRHSLSKKTRHCISCWYYGNVNTHNTILNKCLLTSCDLKKLPQAKHSPARDCFRLPYIDTYQGATLMPLKTEPGAELTRDTNFPLEEGAG